MNEYINEMPLIVRNSIKGVSDENRQGILIYLLKKGPKSFTEISKDLNISKNNLSHHIKILMRYGLTYNFYNRNEFDDKYSFYEISKLGRGLMDTLINFINQKTPKEEEECFEPITAGEATYPMTVEEGSVSVLGYKVGSSQSVFAAGIWANDEAIIFGSPSKKKPEILQLEQEW